MHSLDLSRDSVAKKMGLLLGHHDGVIKTRCSDVDDSRTTFSFYDDMMEEI